MLQLDTYVVEKLKVIRSVIIFLGLLDILNCRPSKLAYVCSHIQIN